MVLRVSLLSLKMYFKHLPDCNIVCILSVQNLIIIIITRVGEKNITDPIIPWNMSDWHMSGNWWSKLCLLYVYMVRQRICSSQSRHSVAPNKNVRQLFDCVIQKTYYQRRPLKWQYGGIIKCHAVALNCNWCRLFKPLLFPVKYLT